MTDDDDLADLKSRYRGSFDGHLPFGTHPALLVVDLVMAYLDPESPLYLASGAAVLASNERLIAVCRAVGVPVIFTNVVYQADGRDGGLFYRKVPALKVFNAGSPTGRFPPSIQPRPDEIIVTKQYASAFFGTALASTLRTMSVDCVMITGFSTSGCVRATALDALQNGFAPFVVRDGCGDRTATPHEANLFDLQAKYAEVVSEESIVQSLRALGR